MQYFSNGYVERVNGCNFFFERQTARRQKQKDINTISVTNVARDAIDGSDLCWKKKISRSNQEIFQVCIGIDNGNFDNV